MNITELDNMNSYGKNSDNVSYEEHSINYWENPKKNITKEKVKKVSFNDILTNMNLVVNKEGVLQSMILNKQNITKQSEYLGNDNNNFHYDQNNLYEGHAQRVPQFISQNHANISKDVGLEPALKNSYIYNKYFKDYVASNTEKPKPRVPQTIEEYRKMLLEDKISAIKHKKKIEEIKSKKLIFTTVPGAQTNTRNIIASKNNLRTMNFG